MTGGTRPWVMTQALKASRAALGVIPGPPVVLSWRRELLHPRFMDYILRGMHGSGGWSKGEAELFAAFVSDLDSCHF
jgi:hypothetical protein